MYRTPEEPTDNISPVNMRSLILLVHLQDDVLTSAFCGAPY